MKYLEGDNSAQSAAKYDMSTKEYLLAMTTEEKLSEVLSGIADYVQGELEWLYAQLGEKSAYREIYPDGAWEREVWETQAIIDALIDLRYRFHLKEFESRPGTDHDVLYQEVYRKTIEALKSQQEYAVDDCDK